MRTNFWAMSLPPLRLAGVLAASAAFAVGQLEVHGSPPLANLIRHTRAVLAQYKPRSGTGLARAVVAQLRLGEVSTARRLLTDYTKCDEPALILWAHATFARATGTIALNDTHRNRLERALSRSEQPEARSFCRAMLVVHGRYCLAQLDAPHQRARHERCATTRLLALESQTWQPGRGHYRPTPCNGRLLVPEAADASLLIPHSFGMLIATGDRLTRHLDATLRAHEEASGGWRDVLPAQQPALLLLAAAQLGDRKRMARSFPAVVQQRASQPALAALNLNAVFHAVTGARLAAGAGLGNRWLHLKPWLPNAGASLEVRGMLAMGHRLTLALHRSEPGAATKVSVQLTTKQPGQLPLVVANRWQQFVTTVTRGQPFTCELPAAAVERHKEGPLPTRTKPDHDALQRRFGAR